MDRGFPLVNLIYLMLGLHVTGMVSGREAPQGEDNGETRTGRAQVHVLRHVDGGGTSDEPSGGSGSGTYRAPSAKGRTGVPRRW